MRKLAIVCGTFSVGVFLARFLIPAAWLFPLALVLVPPAIVLLFLHRRWLLPLILGLCALSASFYVYGMHTMVFLDRAHELEGAERFAECRVLTAPSGRDDWTRVEVMLGTDEDLGLRAVLYDRSGALKSAGPGDLVRGRFLLHAADTRYGEDYDNDLAGGLYLTANPRGKLTVVPERRFSLRGFASTVNRRLSERIEAVFPQDTAAFFRALILGDKTELYEDDALHLSLSRAGMMHIVAVSGMHIAFLVGMLRQLLGNTRRASLLSILLIWSFVLLTGASPSAIRAALMQTLVLLAPIFGREDDPPTSLLLALALILLGNPFAAGSVGLQLSFASLAGIQLFSDRIRRAVLSAIPKRWPHKLRAYLSSNAANSLSVLVFTTPLIGWYFGYVSVLSPLSNLLTLWAVPICFGFGYLACLVSLFFLPAARLFAWALSWLARYIAWVAGIVSAPGFSCLYLCLKLNWLWLLLVYLLFFGAALLFRPGWKRWFFPTGLALFSLFALLTATRLYYASGPGSVTAVDVGQGQSIVIFSGEKTVVVDCGNINSLSDAGDLTGSYLCSRGRTGIDCLVLTHLHADHADGVLRLMEYLPVGEIVLGQELEDPNGLLPAIRDSALRHGTALRVLRHDQILRDGAIRLHLFTPGSVGDLNERCLTAKISVGAFDLLVTGDVDAAAERELLREHELSGVELLIVGHHGSKYSSCPELLRSIGAKEAIVSCGFNSFGHPTPETLERLAEYGYTVYRTDEDGTVELRLP